MPLYEKIVSYTPLRARIQVLTGVGEVILALIFEVACFIIVRLFLKRHSLFKEEIVHLKYEMISYKREYAV